MSKRAEIEDALSRINDPEGEGARAFTRVYADGARLAADHADHLANLGIELPKLAGLPISIKDLFDVRGEPTTAGSRVLATTAPASNDARAVALLRQAGAAIIGKTNMTEFAFSGLGLNPHYGTPLCSWDRQSRRIPGGSSSGAAISVADGMAMAAIGTDTGGSCRIPAAFNGLVGMKPTAASVSMKGVLPLSPSLDSVGPIARDVQTCADVYAVLAETRLDIQALRPRQLRMGVLRNYVLDDMDPRVSNSYSRALSLLSAAGIELQDLSTSVLSDIHSVFRNGGLVAAEAFSWHEDLLANSEVAYDPKVSSRIRRGSLSTATDYINFTKLRRALTAAWNSETARFDTILMPTVPIVAPKISELESDEEYTRVNLLALRNPTLINLFDGCAVSLPCHTPGDAPVGIMLSSGHGQDQRLLSVAKLVESIIAKAH